MPNVPYAWQTKENPILLPSFRTKSLSVLGLMTPCSKLFHQCFEGGVTSEVMIGFLDDFCRTIEKRTVIVLDNAPIHKSKIFQAKIKEWEEQDLFIYFIPPYSPELNLIEILWNSIKHRWLSFDAYDDFDSLKTNLNYVLNNFGGKYMINFL